MAAIVNRPDPMHSTAAQPPHPRNARAALLATALLLALATLVPPAGGPGTAHAAPKATAAAGAANASEATLHALFDAEQMPERMRQIMQAVDQAQLDAIASIADPAEQERKRKAYATAQPVMQQHFAWQKLRPLVTEVYQTQYTEADAQALLAFYGTAPGQLHLNKLQPAMIEATLALAKFMDERVDALFDSSDDQGRAKGPKPPKPTAWTAADAHDGLAADLVRLLMQDEFNARMQRLESAMRAQTGLVQSGAPSKQQKQWFANISQRMRAEIRFDTVLPLIVQPLRAHLAPEELRVLLASERSPARKAQRAKALAASDALSARLQQTIRTEIFPELLAAMARAENAAAPANSDTKR
ncbi:hypothetical protein PMI14_04770 [Acidovorax sp. CF316]|nr:hypothetical protein PMI14_04770 [Acidovorax sp. CF316]